MRISSRRIPYSSYGLINIAMSATGAPTEIVRMFLAVSNVDAEGRLTALHVSWIYDSFASLYLLNYLQVDQDGDQVLTEEEKAKIESLGGLEKLIEEFKKRLEEQQKRHQGGNKWIGTGGTSPFGQEYLMALLTRLSIT